MHIKFKDAWKYVINDIDKEIDLDYICQINGYVSRNESLKWGCLRDGNVGISGTDYIPNIPDRNEVIDELNNILEIENITLRAMKYMLYGMRKQLFWDGNKKASMIIANKILISHGKGIITIKEENILEFNKLLSNYYTTNDDKDIIDFIYNKCLFGIEY